VDGALDRLALRIAGIDFDGPGILALVGRGVEHVGQDFEAAILLLVAAGDEEEHHGRQYQGGRRKAEGGRNDRAAHRGSVV